MTDIKETVKSFDNGHWQFPEQLDSTKAFGFIYLIKDKSTGMMYIGRKNFRSLSKLHKGKESAWRSYASSSEQLQELIKIKGKQNFEFYVLEQYYTLGGLGWGETWSQAVVEVPSKTSRFLNRLIPAIKWKSKEDITQRHKDRLAELIK
jgi:hypothetical protein